MRYCSDTMVPVEPQRDIVMTLGYQWNHQEIFTWHLGTSRTTARFSNDTRLPSGQPRYTVITPFYKCSNKVILLRN